MLWSFLLVSFVLLSFNREMAIVMDAPADVAMTEPGAEAPGFVYDASSGLYYDAR